MNVRIVAVTRGTHDWLLTTREHVPAGSRKKGKQTSFGLTNPPADRALLQRLIGVQCVQDKGSLSIGEMEIARRTKDGLTLHDGWYSITQQWWKDMAKAMNNK